MKKMVLLLVLITASSISQTQAICKVVYDSKGIPHTVCYDSGTDGGQTSGGTPPPGFRKAPKQKQVRSVKRTR